MVAFWLYLCGILVISTQQQGFISEEKPLEFLGIIFWPFVVSFICIYFMSYNLFYLIRGR